MTEAHPINVDSRIVHAMWRQSRGSGCHAARAVAPVPARVPAPVPAAPEPGIASPGLDRRHVEGARLFATREDMLAAMRFAAGGVVAEIGVARGDFSAFILDRLAPTTFVAFDIFTMHENPIIWGQPSEILFEGKTQLDFYRHRFADRSEVVVEEGESHITLARYPDRSFDLIYVDGAHDYEGVKRDADLARRKIKDDGVVIFNDYIMQDMVGAPYGVVRTVNELLVSENWRVIGFAFQRDMFCDIACARADAPPRLHPG